MGEPTDPSQPESPEADDALAALDELIAKVDSGSELSASETGPRVQPSAQPDPYPAEARAGDAPPPDGWYVAMKDNAQGPFTVDELRERWSSGDILADSLCWREGMGEWKPLSRLHPLAAAIAPRPREGLKALSAKPTRAPSQPSFAPSAGNMLRSLAERETRSGPPVKSLLDAPKPPPEVKPPPEARPPPEEARPSDGVPTPYPVATPFPVTLPATSPTTPEGPRRVPPPEVRPAVLSAARAPGRDEDKPEKRQAGLGGAKLFLSLFTASVLGGLVGGGLVKMTIPPPPEPVIIHEAPPPAPMPAAALAPPPPPAPAEAPKVEPAAVEPPAVARPRYLRPSAEGTNPELKKKIDKDRLPPPKTKLDKDFQNAFGN